MVALFIDTNVFFPIRSLPDMKRMSWSDIHTI